MQLTPTSFIVLGLLERLGEGTSYDLKRELAATVGNFWSVPHSQLYAEPERLARSGLLASAQEAGGRRRKRYTLTGEGRAALATWRTAAPGEQLPELRDGALLKLFMGADPAPFAAARAAAHERQLEAYEALRATDPGTGPRGSWQVLDAGIGHEREWIRFWSELAG